MIRVLRVLTIYIFLDYINAEYSKTETETSEDKNYFDNVGRDVPQKLLGQDYFNGGSEPREDVYAVWTEFPNHVQWRAPPVVPLKSANNKVEIVYADTVDTRNYEAELKAGNNAEMLETNSHYYQPDAYPDFSRRFVPQYPYTEVGNKNKAEIKSNELTPILADPALVLAVAEHSAVLHAAHTKNPTDEIIRKDILRTGNYWNSIWKEDIDPLALRTKEVKKLEAIRADIAPSSKLYNLASKLKKISPTLLYVINQKK